MDELSNENSIMGCLKKLKQQRWATSHRIKMKTEEQEQKEAEEEEKDTNLNGSDPKPTSL